ncbi:methyltransferase family protein [Rhodovulum imhoffii]|uniref:Methyltransferase family protein n=1 Tax=Rhodovulum imhoffii TaxID=365340 RepID=A0A2T5BL40_9RHOB|nr:glycosyltransferase [Rhodovulum imhoffii]PTM99698.1 methyltransferase family protein [Rhodovulum imhoffii]
MDQLSDKPKLRRATGQHYLEFLADMHQSLKPEWYLEVGTRSGVSLALSSARSVAVDPQFAITEEIVGKKPQLHLFQQTSDEFFESGELERLSVGFDLAFLDGMHLYEFLLRDFMNAERYMASGGHIVLHDCLPWKASMTGRDWRRAIGKAWTGDCWKLVPILQRYRQDLKVEIYDAATTGLVVVSNLAPGNTVLKERYEEIVAEYDEVDTLEEIVGGFDVIPTLRSPWNPRIIRKADVPSFAIQLPVPRPGVQRNWGDYHFGVGLAKALEKKGYRARVQTRKFWMQEEDPAEVDIVLRGRAQYARRPGHATLYWVISGGDNVHSGELEQADHVFAGGEPLRDALVMQFDSDHVSLLPQAFDAERMGPPAPDAERAGICFVGIARGGMRPIVGYALDAGIAPEIWGAGWRETPAAAYVKGDRVENEVLGDIYSRAEIVLNDHTPAMARSGLLSNRVFDALACGTPVISDPIPWMPEEFRPFVETVGSAEEFSLAVARIRAEDSARRAARAAFARKMRETHSFDARADRVIEKARELVCG